MSSEKIGHFAANMIRDASNRNVTEMPALLKFSSKFIKQPQYMKTGGFKKPLSEVFYVIVSGGVLAGEKF